MSNFPFYKQLDTMYCGPTCLRMVSHFYGKIYSQDFFREKSSITKSGVSLYIPKQNNYAVEISLPQPLITNTGQTISLEKEIQGNIDIVTEDLKLIERIFYQLRKIFL